VAAPRLGIRRLPGFVAERAYAAFMNALGLIMEPLQRLLGERRMPYLFVLPNLLVFGIFILFPMALNVYFAMTSGTELYPQNRPFIGLDNFERLLTCTDYGDPNTCLEDRFWRAVRNTGVFVFFQVSGMVAISLLTALVLNRKIVALGFFRSVYFYPVLLSPVVVALIWKWILQRDGALNALLLAIGLQPIDFLLNGTWAMSWIIAVSIWSHMGFYTLILLAGLQSIPLELYDAGAIDGANGAQAFRHITAPLLMPTMLVVLVLSLIRAVQAFDEVFVLTGGGPGSATLLVVQYIYATGFGTQSPRFGMAAAASVTLGAVLLVATLIQLRLGRGSERHLA
jgi:alpha-1,4-digalacturonate transport system permease protein